MLVHIGKIIHKKMLGQYAVPAFNTSDLEITQGIIRAAEVQNAPIVLQTSVGALEYAGIEQLVAMNKEFARLAKVPVALHQDHCKDFELIKQLIGLGYSSVMIDLSALPIEENIKQTREVVKYAHKAGVWVQAEVGRLLGNEDWQNVKSGEDLMTDPDEAAHFVAETGIDTLAVAVGTWHGIPVNPNTTKIMHTLPEHIDLPRLRAIRAKVNIPLVVHGASGVPDDQLAAAVKENVVVFNIDTDLRVAYNEALRKNLNDNPSQYDPRKLLAPATAALQKAAEAKLKILGTSGKA
jgi:fructose-bisphosphate aldolase class II